MPNRTYSFPRRRGVLALLAWRKAYCVAGVSEKQEERGYVRKRVAAKWAGDGARRTGLVVLCEPDGRVRGYDACRLWDWDVGIVGRRGGGIVCSAVKCVKWTGIDADEEGFVCLRMDGRVRVGVSSSCGTRDPVEGWRRDLRRVVDALDVKDGKC